MDFFAFLSPWFWYVMAFAAGALVAWLVARQFIRAESPEEAIEEALDAGSGDHDDRDDHAGRDRADRRGEHDDDDDRSRTVRGRRASDEDVQFGDDAPRARGGRFASLRRGATALGGRR